MQALKKLGLPTDIPVRVLLSSRFNDSVRQLTDDQKQMVGILREVVAQYNRKPAARTRVTDSRSALEALGGKLDGLDHEQTWALFLSADNTPISSQMICKGSLDFTPIDNRAILSKALAYNAKSIIIFHNHPSGNPRPSASDIKGTERLKTASDTLEIALLDHIIVSENSYYSFNDEKVTKLLVSTQSH